MNIWHNLRSITFICTLANVVLWGNNCEAGSWIFLPNGPSQTEGVNAPLLLTDGTILCEGIQGTSTGHMWKLTPDAFGNYASGTWSQMASLPVINGIQYAPSFHAGAVLANGNVVFVGGEYNGPNSVMTNLGAVYHTTHNYWTRLDPPSFFPNLIGDAQSVVLFDGTLMVASPTTRQAAFLNPSTYTWTEAPNTSKKFDQNDEEGWTLLPNGTVLAVNCAVRKQLPTTTAEYYTYPTGGWTPTQTTGESLTSRGLETGAAVLMNDGNVLAIGASGNTGIYDYRTNAWTTGPDLPVIDGKQMAQSDGPAALLPNGNVLVAASPLNTALEASSPVHIFEYDGTEFIQQPDMPHTSGNSSAILNMLILPTGEIFVTHRSHDMSIYVPDGTYKPEWRPQISHVSSNLVLPNHTYVVHGTLFNGMSQGAMYGDDYQSATNYPLVRITNVVTKHVFYCRTYNHSSMAVAAVDVPVFTYFDVPLNIDSGYSMLEVVTNGIPSEPVGIVVNSAVTPKVTATPTKQTIHSGGTANIVFTSTIPGTTFSWALPVETNVSGGTAGSGSTLVQTLTLTSGSSGYAVYTIIPIANGIQGAPITVNITVNN